MTEYAEDAQVGSLGEVLMAAFDEAKQGGADDNSAAQDVTNAPEDKDPHLLDEEEEEGAEKPEAEEDEPEDEPEEPVEDKEPNGRYNVTLPDGSTEKKAFEEIRKGYEEREIIARERDEIAGKYQELESTIKQRETDLSDAALKVTDYFLNSVKLFDPVTSLQKQINDAIEIGDETQEMRLRFQLNDLQERIRQAENIQRYEKDQQKGKQEEEGKRKKADYIAEQRTLLAKRLPQLQTEEGVKKVQSAIAETMNKVGLKRDEIDEPDARYAEAFYYAGLYLKAQQLKTEVAPALQSKAVAPKPTGRPRGVDQRKEAAHKQFHSKPFGEGSLAAVFRAEGLA